VNTAWAKLLSTNGVQNIIKPQQIKTTI
jgi:hypothetical protein